MIHLDTNYLIRLVVSGSSEAQNVDRWLASGQTFAASAIAWTEFLNGPVQPLDITLVESIIESRILPFEKATAVLAADLFNKTGRRRGSRFDCLIAATAILSHAEVATLNEADFQVFVAHGLQLAANPPPVTPTKAPTGAD